MFVKVKTGQELQRETQTVWNGEEESLQQLINQLWTEITTKEEKHQVTSQAGIKLPKRAPKQLKSKDKLNEERQECRGTPDNESIDLTDFKMVVEEAPQQLNKQLKYGNFKSVQEEKGKVALAA